MTITQVHPIAVVFTLPQRNLPPIVEEMAKGPVTVAAWSGEDNRELAQGTLLTPDNAIDTTTGTIRLKATFPNEDNRLWPGQFVEARLLLRTEHQVVTVPTQAVQHGQIGLYVYVVKPDSTVQRQTVVGGGPRPGHGDHQGPGCRTGDRAGRPVAAAGRHAGRSDGASGRARRRLIERVEAMSGA